MSKQFTDIESLFQNAYNEHSVQASPNVLQGIKRKLFVKDFFSVNFKKFNVFYAVAGAFLAVSIPASQLNKAEPQTNIETTIVEEKSEGITEEAIIEEISNAKGNITEEETMASVAENVTPIKNLEPQPILTASFIANANEGCVPFTVEFKNKSENAEVYNWNFGVTNSLSTAKNPSFTYSEPGVYTASLEVKSANGVSNSYSQTITVHEKPVANIELDVENSKIKERKIRFKNKSKKAEKYFWDFGDNLSSEVFSPEHEYADFGVYNVKLLVINEFGCSDTASFKNTFIAQDYELAFPLNFKPNTHSRGNNGFYEQNGSYSVFYPSNNGAINYELKIYASNGIEVFSTNNIKQGWNGYIKGRLAPQGKYFYKAKGIYPNKKSFDLKGSFSVNVNINQIDDYSY